MKKFDLKKIILPVLTVLAVFILFGSIAYALAKEPERTPENKAKGMADEYSRVIYTGKGYHTKDIQNSNKGETAKIEAEVLEEKEEEKKRNDKKESVKKKDAGKEDDSEAETNEQKEDPEDDSEAETDEQKEDPEDDSEAETDEQKGDPEEETDEQEEDPEDDGESTNEYDEGNDNGDNSHPDPGDDDEDQEGAEKPEEEPDDPNAGKYPIIASDLEDGETVSQSYRAFFVRATDYQGRYINASGVKVTAVPVGGSAKTLYSTSDDGYNVGYRLNMQAESYTITIKATDKKGRSSIATYTIKKGDGGDPEPEGEITFSLEAGTVGLGNLIGPTKVEFYQGEQLPYIIDRALKSHGYTYRYQGDLERGFYLKHVVKTGITDGAGIPADLLEKLEDAGYDPSDYHQDSLGQYDFSGQSGWIYSVNGANMSSGMASYYPADGDVVRLRFSLYNGADVGGGVGTSSFGKEW